LATLVVLGGLAWMFLSGGDLGSLQMPANGPTAGGAGAGGWSVKPPWGSAQPANGGAYPSVVSSQASQAPIATPLGSGPTIRIASFNIQVFGKTKADKPYVMQTLAEIIRQFDVVAIQEIRTTDDYLIPNFVKLINSVGRRYDHVIGPRLGNTQSKEQYAFIYDADRVEVDHQSVFTLGDPENLLHREPLVATFRTRGVNPDEAFTFTLVNVHTDPDVVTPSPRLGFTELDALAEAYRAIRRSSQEDDVIMLGDFNVDNRHMGRLGQIPAVTPLINGIFTNTRQNQQYDNIVIHQPSTTEYAGNSGVFDVIHNFNLSLDQAEQVSDHFPVWAEFSVYELDYAGRIASRRALTR
jgi:endonuclease/exonuclease/phosphatase family metal-dependent hydrolase